MKKKFLLKGLCCANCGAKIERQVDALEKVKQATLNFNTSTLIVDLEDLYSKDIIKDISKIVKNIEPDVKVIDKMVMNKVRTIKNKNIKSNKLLNVQHCNCGSNNCLGCSQNHTHVENEIHNDDNGEGITSKKSIRKIILGVAFLITATFVKNTPYLDLILYIVAYILIGGDILLSSIKNILKGQVFDENFLMSLATIAALTVKQYPEAVAVMLYYKIGEYFQERAVNKSRKSITELMNIRPDYANLLKDDDSVEIVDPQCININDVIVVKPGEKIPLDGIVIEGDSSVDTSAITGESVIREIFKDSKVLSGYINKNKVIKIKVTNIFEESTVAKILDLTENAAANKANTEKFITKFARYYTPTVVILAIILAIVPMIVFKEQNVGKWIYRAAVFLVVSCPCALVLSIPLSYFAGIGSASKKGVLIKSGSALEALNKVSTVVFDKTGTLTKGVFKVSNINPINITSDELLKYAAYVENFSNHPIAKSILKYYKNPIDNSIIKDYEEVAGRGVTALINGVRVYAGNHQYMEELNVEYKKEKSSGVVLYLALDKEFIGSIVINDEVKEDSKKAIISLKNIGIKNIAMLTGDRKNAAQIIGNKLGLDKIYYELLPQDKVSKLKNIKDNISKGHKTVFVGDGINDAPVLAMADIGVSMGGLGSDAAIEASDMVIMSDEPSKLVDALLISKKTNKIVWQNIIFILLVKIIVLLLASIGLGTMWMAVFADVGVAVISILNSLRILK